MTKTTAKIIQHLEKIEKEARSLKAECQTLERQLKGVGAEPARKYVEKVRKSFENLKRFIPNTRKELEKIGKKIQTTRRKMERI